MSRKTRSQIIRRNVLVTPIVLLVRVPLLVPLAAIAEIGHIAGLLADWLGYRIPAWDRLPVKVSAEQRKKIAESFGTADEVWK
jgi:hypothetical protein